jgi:hypothetical protein
MSNMTQQHGVRCSVYINVMPKHQQEPVPSCAGQLNDSSLLATLHVWQCATLATPCLWWETWETWEP